MDKYQCELFGDFRYADKMTYEELIDCESMLTTELELIFQDGGAAHLDFTPLGDNLMIQCAFEYQNPEILRDIAQEIADLLPSGVRGRLLALKPSLDSYTMYWIAKGEWQEKVCPLPTQAPADAIRPK